VVPVLLFAMIFTRFALRERATCLNSVSVAVIIPMGWLSLKRSSLSSINTKELSGSGGLLSFIAGCNLGEQEARQMAESAYSNCFILTKIGDNPVRHSYFNRFLVKVLFHKSESIIREYPAYDLICRYLVEGL